MKSSKREGERARKLKSKYEKAELDDSEAKEAMSIALPYATDSCPYARRDLSKGLVKLFKSWSSRGNNVCLFKENFSAGALVQSATAVASVSLQFTLNLLGNLNSYIALFDQYRVQAVIVTATPTVFTNSGSPYTNYMPRLYSVLDYDDAALLTTINSAQQYDSCIVSPPCTSITRSIKPRIALAAYNGSVFTGYANVADQWIDLASPTIPHFGVKLVIEAGVASQPVLQVYELEVVMFFEMRNQR